MMAEPVSAFDPLAVGSRPAAPVHVAIIMDGNRRWARSRGLPAAAGHREGAGSVRRAIEACAKRGVRYLTLYAFSSENWGRPAGEIGELLGLMRYYLKSELKSLIENDIRVRMIGERARFDPDILALIADAEQRTRANGRMDLVVALNYGSRREILRAVRRVASEARAGQLEPEAIDEELFGAMLETSGIPDPDLLIRTSGEQRISNFLLWQIAYTELVFLPVSWPEFREEHLDHALAEYARRERRYGADAS
jgi:undecaprenyl diphosphate synthase